MMNFKRFLNERIIKHPEIEDVDESQIAHLLNTHCSDYINAVSNGYILFRGDNFLKPNSIFDASDIKRTSKDTNGIYHLLLDTSDDFKNYPSRNESLICSTNIKLTSFYGRSHVIVPFNGTQLACTTVRDLLGAHISSPFFDGTLIDLTSRMATFFRYCNIDRSNINNLSPATLDATMAKIDDEKLIKAFNILSPFDESDKSYLIKLLDPNKRFTDLSSELLNHNTFSLSLIKFGDKIPENLYKGIEVWFKGKALVLSTESFKSVLIKLLNDGYSINKYLLQMLDES